MKTSVVRQTQRAADDAFEFAVPALMLAAALAICALILMWGAMSAEPPPAAAAPVSEPLTTFEGA